MIYICGDTHGDIDIKKLYPENLKACGIEPKEGDYVIICGDFGGVWYYHDNPNREFEDLKIQRWYAEQPFTTLFVDGNHENFDVLSTYAVEEWNGGKVQKINDKLIHLMRGQVFNIEGKTFFTMGGAESHDKQLRVEFIDWWRQELPNSAEYDEALHNLNKVDFSVDYIISHCQPSWFFSRCFPSLARYERPNSLVTFFDEIDKMVDYKHWYSGHLHIDKTINDITCLYSDISIVS